MLPPREEVEAKIRAMRAAGYPPEQIGYSIGWDFGQIRERQRIGSVIETVRRKHEEEIRQRDRYYMDLWKEKDRNEETTIPIFMGWIACAITFVIGAVLF